jgi:DNA-binding XRE family transcriptional regulator
VARKFKELEDRMSPSSRARSDAITKKLIQQMAPVELRAAREMTQTNLAKVLEVSQSEVSKIENRADMYVSTLASYIEAMGGTLDIRAVFPEGVVRITQFGDLVKAD